MSIYIPIHSIREVQTLQQLILMDLTRACRKELHKKTEIPKFLTPDKLLEFWVKFLKANLREQKKVIQEYFQPSRKGTFSELQFRESLSETEKRVR